MQGSLSSIKPDLADVQFLPKKLKSEGKVAGQVGEGWKTGGWAGERILRC
jgi:hypothetical protein